MISPKFARFLLVGLLNTTFSYGLFAILIKFDVAYPVAIGIATVMGIIFNFQTTGRIVFGNSQWSKMRRFALVYAVIYCLNIFGVALLLSLEFNVYLANALLILPLALLNYTLQQKLVFQTP